MWLDDPDHADFAVLPDGRLLDRVHSPEVCVPPCVLHAPTDHHMREWPLHWRQDRHMFERICPHGIGHPDPDDLCDDKTHGCDGCCRDA